MKRKCTLPQGVHPDTVTSSLSKSGLLTVQAPARQAIQNGEHDAQNGTSGFSDH